MDAPIKIIITGDVAGLDSATAKGRGELDKLAQSASSSSSSLAGLVRGGVVAFLGSHLVGAAFSASQALYEASARAQNLRTTLDFASGGNSTRELAFLQETTKSLGLEMRTTSVAYAGFIAAARGTALEGSKARDVFTSIAAASSVMGLSAEQTSGVLLALQQMISKGTVQSEELRGQLGERLPGAFQTAARAMGVTTAELGKMLEQGEVVASDFLPRFAAQLRSEIGDAAQNAAQRLDASVNQMGNAWERFKKTVGDSGAAEAGSVVLKALSNDFEVISETMEISRLQGQGFFRQMAEGVGALVGRATGLQNFSAVFLTLDERIAAADQRLAELRKKSEEGWGVNIYFKADLASARAEVAALQAVAQAMGRGGAGAGRGDGNLQLEAERQRAAGPFTDAKSLDEVRKGAKLRTDIETEGWKKSVDIAKSFGQAIAMAGTGTAQAIALAQERDQRLIAISKETAKNLKTFDGVKDSKPKAYQEAPDSMTSVLARYQAEFEKTFDQFDKTAVQMGTSWGQEEKQRSEQQASFNQQRRVDLENLSADLLSQTSALNVSMIANDRERGLAQIELERQTMQARIDLLGIEGPEQERAQAALAANMVARQAQLTEQLKPEWQRLLENWSDTTQLMANSYDQAMTDVLHSGEDAWVELASTGRLNVKSMVQGILADLARLQFRQFAASLSSGSFLGSLLGLFDGGLSVGAGAYGGTGLGITGGASLPDTLRGGAATGTNYVQRDMVTLIHEGEAITPKAYNPAAGGRGGALQITLAPIIQIDARSDQGQIAQLVGGAMQQTKQQMYAELQAQGVI